MESAEANGHTRDATTTVLSGFFKTPNPSAGEHEVTFGFVLDPPLSPFQGAYSRVVYWLEAELDVKFASDNTWHTVLVTDVGACGATPDGLSLGPG